MVSEATKMAVIGNMQMDTKDIVEVIVSITGQFLIALVAAGL